MYTRGREVPSTGVWPWPPCPSGAGCVAAPVASAARRCSHRAAASGHPHGGAPLLWWGGDGAPATFERGRGSGFGLSQHSLPRCEGGCGLLPSLQWSDRGFLRCLRTSPRAQPSPDHFRHCGVPGGCTAPWVPVGAAVLHTVPGGLLGKAIGENSASCQVNECSRRHWRGTGGTLLAVPPLRRGPAVPGAPQRICRREEAQLLKCSGVSRKKSCCGHSTSCVI